MDDFGSDMFDTLRGRGMVVLAPTMAPPRRTSYSWFDPRHGGQAFQDHILEKINLW
jgi:hypothetical protein